MADRAHDPAIEAAQRFFRRGWQRVAVQSVSPCTDRQIDPFDSEALAFGRRLHDFHAFGHNFGPDVIAEQDSDLHTAPLAINFTKLAPRRSQTQRLS